MNGTDLGFAAPLSAPDPEVPRWTPEAADSDRLTHIPDQQQQRTDAAGTYAPGSHISL